MHNGDLDGMGYGNGWWLLMAIMMVVFWGGIIWIGVTLLKRHRGVPSIAAGSTATSARPSAPEILAERLARGEIDPSEYRERLDALRHGDGR